jgi:hypothetical protein
LQNKMADYANANPPYGLVEGMSADERAIFGGVEKIFIRCTLSP